MKIYKVSILARHGCRAQHDMPLYMAKMRGFQSSPGMVAGRNLIFINNLSTR